MAPLTQAARVGFAGGVALVACAAEAAVDRVHNSPMVGSVGSVVDESVGS